MNLLISHSNFNHNGRSNRSNRHTIIDGASCQAKSVSDFLHMSLLTTLTRIDGIFHAYCITFVLRVHFKQLREDLEKGRKRSSTTSILMDTHRGLYPIHPFMIFFLLLLTLLSEDKQRQIFPHYLVFCQQIWNPLPYPLMVETLTCFSKTISFYSVIDEFFQNCILLRLFSENHQKCRIWIFQFWHFHQFLSNLNWPVW